MYFVSPRKQGTLNGLVWVNIVCFLGKVCSPDVFGERVIFTKLISSVNLSSCFRMLSGTDSQPGTE